jgi:hypothetical protein
VVKQDSTLIGRPIDGLTLAERLDHVGRWVALELYSPKTLPLRKIAAEGVSAAECVAQLAMRGLNPADYELHLLKPPY